MTWTTVLDVTDLEDLRHIVNACFLCLFIASSTVKNHVAKEHMDLHYKLDHLKPLQKGYP